MKTVKFIHISDVLLGTDVDKDTSWGNDRKKEIYETFEKIIERAADAGVDFLFIAGNLFDHKPDDGELEWLDGVLGRLKDTVVIYVAGSSDNLGGEAAIMSYRFRSAVCVMGSPAVGSHSSLGGGYRDEQATMAMDHLHFPEKDLDVYGVSYFDGRMDAHAIDEAEPDDRSVHNVLVACGGGRHRMPVNWHSLRDSGFDYIAMGGRQKYSAEIPGKAYYPGSPEAVSAESTGPHGYIYGEIGIDGIKAEFVPVAAREYKRIDYHVDNHTRNGELGEAIERLLNMEGAENIYTINIVRDGGCEKSFDISEMLSGYRILAVNGERFERTDYSEYVKANKNTEFGKLLGEMNVSELERSGGVKLAVDMMIDMSGLYARGSRRMGNDTFYDIRRQVMSVLSVQCQAYEDDDAVREYMAIRDDYKVSPDVLEELNAVWAKERAAELEITTLRRRLDELPKQYRRDWMRTGIRAALVPLMALGILSAAVLAMVMTGGEKIPDARFIYALIIALVVTGAAYYVGYAVSKYWGRRRRAGRNRLESELDDGQKKLAALCAERDEIHSRRVSLQSLDGRRRDMYEKMTTREKILDEKLRDIQLMKVAMETLGID